MSGLNQGVFDLCQGGGGALKQFRERHGIELSELGRLTCLGEDTFYLAETGHRPITLEVAWAYFEAYRRLRLHKTVSLPAPEMRLRQKFGRLRKTLSFIGAILRAIREQHGSALAALAERFNLTTMALDKVELGKSIPRKQILGVYTALLQEVFAAPPLPSEARELLVFIRVGLIRLSRSAFAKQGDVPEDAVKQIEQSGQYQPGIIAAYRQALAQFKTAKARELYAFPADLVRFRKERHIPRRLVAEILEMTESGVARMEQRPRKEPLSAKQIIAYLEAAFRLGGATVGDYSVFTSTLLKTRHLKIRDRQARVKH